MSLNIPTNIVDVQDEPISHLTGWTTVDVTLHENSVGEYFTNYKFSDHEDALTFIKECKDFLSCQ